jgi:hypothetical protein
MLTFTKQYTRFADAVGISLTQNTQDLQNGKDDINQGLRLFKNAARRAWTRVEKVTNIVANQQYYQMPPDCVRVTRVRVNVGGLDIPVEEIDSEKRWNRLNIIPTATVNVPTFYFVKGNNEIGLWPTPATVSTGGLKVSYEPRLVDMVVDDITSTANTYTITNPGTPVTVSLVNQANTLVFSQAIATVGMVGRWVTLTDGTDGNWYQISGYTDGTHLTLGNDYVGTTTTTATFLLGQAPDIPEDYHPALWYFACYQFYLKRKDNDQAINYKSLFTDLYNQYVEVYAAKSTGQVQDDTLDLNYNIFGLPPTNITG